MKRNPPLVVYSNPPTPGQIMGTRVYAVEYRHADDGLDYRHDFEGKVKMIALENGDILLKRVGGGQPLWEDF